MCVLLKLYNRLENLLPIEIKVNIDILKWILKETFRIFRENKYFNSFFNYKIIQ